MKVTKMILSGAIFLVMPDHGLANNDAHFNTLADKTQLPTIEYLRQPNEYVENRIDYHERSMTVDLAQRKKRNDADVFAMWEKGISAEAVYRAVAADGDFSLAEVLAAADVVLELKDLIAQEKAGKNDARKLVKLQDQLKNFDALYRRILKKSREPGQLASSVPNLLPHP